MTSNGNDVRTLRHDVQEETDTYNIIRVGFSCKIAVSLWKRGLFVLLVVSNF